MAKNLNLWVSAVIVIGVACIYGVYPSKIIPLFFDIQVTGTDLHNVFRAVMGLYLAMAGYWIYGAMNSDHWHSATLTNVLFMGGLATGRIISSVFDGISVPFTKGLLLELLFAFWGIYNLRKYSPER